MIPTYQIFKAISNAITGKPQHANASLNVGVFNENMGSVKQADFLLAVSNGIKAPVTNDKYEEGYIETEKGARTYQTQKDFWLGNPT